MCSWPQLDHKEIELIQPKGPSSLKIRSISQSQLNQHFFSREQNNFIDEKNLLEIPFVIFLGNLNRMFFSNVSHDGRTIRVT